MNKAALFFIVAAALAGAAFFALRTESPASGAPETVGFESDTGDSKAAVEPTEGPDLGVPEAEAKVLDREVATTAAASAPSPGAHAAASSKKVVKGRANGTLTGRIMDATGAPLEGALVKVARSGLEDIFADDLTPEDALQSATRKRPEVVSDEAGRFALEVRAGNVRLSVLADSFAPYSMSTAVKGDAESDVGDLRLAAGVLLSGRVVDGDGNGIAGAKLIREAESAGGITVLGGPQDVVAQTDAGGAFSINQQAVGPYEFYVTHEEHPSGQLEGETERAGETTSGLEVVLQDGVFLRGTVQGIPEGGKEFSVTADIGSAGSQDFTFRTGPSASRRAVVQADGSFEVRGLRPNTDYHLLLTEGRTGLWGSMGRCSQPASVTTPAEGLGPAVRLTHSSGATVSFNVTGPDGAPRVPETIEAGFSYEREWENVEKDEAAGRCVLSGLWPDEGGETLILRLRSKGFEDWEARDLVVYPDGVMDLGTIALVPRPSVRVTVFDDATGEPVVGAMVTMAPPKKNDRSMSFRVSSRVSSRGDGDEESSSSTVFGPEDSESGKTDQDGVVSLDATAGATVEISVEDGSHAPSTIGPIDLPELMTVFEQEVRLAQGGGMRVTALDPSGTPAKGYSIEIKGEDMETAAMRSDRTGDDGVMSVAGLAAGVHRVRLGKRGGGNTMILPSIGLPGMESEEDDDSWIEVTVLPGEIVEVALAAPAIGSLEGSVAELGRALSGAEIKLRKPEGDNPLAGIMMLGGGNNPSATSDARGEFRIVDVEAGEYELVVDHGTRAMPYTQDITIEGGEQEVQLDLSVTEVTGVVLDHNGEPLAGARVEAERVAEDSGTQRTRVSVVMMTDSGGGGGVMMTTGEDEAEPTTTDAEGRYRLRGVSAGVRIKVKATADGYDEVESEAFTVADGTTESDVEVRFELSGSIRIEVEGFSGRAIAMIRRKNASRSAEPKIQMLQGESTTVDALEPGDWTVRLQGMGGQTLSADPDSVDVNVVGGETAVASFKIR